MPDLNAGDTVAESRQQRVSADRCRKRRGVGWRCRSRGSTDHCGGCAAQPRIGPGGQGRECGHQVAAGPPAQRGQNIEERCRYRCGRRRCGVGRRDDGGGGCRGYDLGCAGAGRDGGGRWDDGFKVRRGHRACGARCLGLADHRGRGGLGIGYRRGVFRRAAYAVRADSPGAAGRGGGLRLSGLRCCVGSRGRWRRRGGPGSCRPAPGFGVGGRPGLRLCRRTGGGAAGIGVSGIRCCDARAGE